MKKFLPFFLALTMLSSSFVAGCSKPPETDPTGSTSATQLTEPTETTGAEETVETTEASEPAAAEPRFVEHLPVATQTPYERYLRTPTGGVWWLRPYGFVFYTWQAVVPGYGFDKETKTASFLWTLDRLPDHATLGDIYLEMIDSTYERSTVAFVIDQLTYYTPVEGGYMEYDIPPTQSRYELDMHTGKAGFIIGSIGDIPLGEVAAIYVKVRYVGEVPAEEPAS